VANEDDSRSRPPGGPRSQAEPIAIDLPTDLGELLRVRLELLQKVTECSARIDALKVKCSTCNLLVLPGLKCPRCSDAHVFVEEE
jgi:hypothetical protein